MDVTELKHRDFIEAGFTCETDKNQPTVIIYRFENENTNLVFSFDLATDVCWLVADGRDGSDKTYCHAEISTIGQVRSLLNLYQGNLERNETPRRRKDDIQT